MDAALVGQVSARQEQDGQGLGWTSVSKAGTGWTRPWLDKCQQGKSRMDKALVLVRQASVSKAKVQWTKSVNNSKKGEKCVHSNTF